MTQGIIEHAADGTVTIYPHEIKPTSEKPSVLALSLPKAGSVMLDGIMKMLCPYVDMRYVSIMEAFYVAGVMETNLPAETSQLFKPKGVCYGGFRYYPTQFEVPIADSAPAILLVRDPRDMLTSLYFSALKSHPARGAGNKNPAAEAAQTTGIDDYVKKFFKMYRLRMNEYSAYIGGHPNTKLFRYEDIIYEKPRFVKDICTHFEWEIPEPDQIAIAKHWDLVPDAEKPDEHVRQVHPGNFRTKLQRETIAFLEDALKSEMAAFGYNTNMH